MSVAKQERGERWEQPDCLLPRQDPWCVRLLYFLLLRLCSCGCSFSPGVSVRTVSVCQCAETDIHVTAQSASGSWKGAWLNFGRVYSGADTAPPSSDFSTLGSKLYQRSSVVSKYSVVSELRRQLHGRVAS